MLINIRDINPDCYALPPIIDVVVMVKDDEREFQLIDETTIIMVWIHPSEFLTVPDNEQDSHDYEDIHHKVNIHNGFSMYLHRLLPAVVSSQTVAN